jgi:Tol biopolymer transport system component
VRDLNTNTTEIISLQPDGSETDSYSQHPQLSDDGQIVAYQSKFDTPAGTSSGLTVVTVTERLPDPNITTHLQLSFIPGNTDSEARLHPSISGNGQFVGFETRVTLQQTEPASGRPIGLNNNAAWDAFVYDRITQPTPPTLRVSLDSADNQADGDSYHTSLSDDGQVVAFYSYATNLVPGDTKRQRRHLRSRYRYWHYRIDQCRRRRRARQRRQLQPERLGQWPVRGVVAHWPTISSRATAMAVGISSCVIDSQRLRSASAHRRPASRPITTVSEPSISDDGRFIAFRSNASNLVDDDRNQRFDIFVQDRQSGQTVRVGQPVSGESNGHSNEPAISGNGQWIVFESDATNLVANDTNQARDIFRVANPHLTRAAERGRD